MKTGKLEAEPHGSQVHDIAIADEAINTPVSRRARLMGASALAGGTLLGLAIAAGVATVFGASPAAAQCFSGTGGNLLMAACDVTAASGLASTAVGSNANATGTTATAYGNTAIAIGDGRPRRAGAASRTATTRPRPA